MSWMDQCLEDCFRESKFDKKTSCPLCRTENERVQMRDWRQPSTNGLFGGLFERGNYAQVFAFFLRCKKANNGRTDLACSAFGKGKSGAIFP